MDGDGMGDICDDDIDGDGIANRWDFDPMNKMLSIDLDGDGKVDFYNNTDVVYTCINGKMSYNKYVDNVLPFCIDTKDEEVCRPNCEGMRSYFNGSCDKIDECPRFSEIEGDRQSEIVDKYKNFVRDFIGGNNVDCIKLNKDTADYYRVIPKYVWRQNNHPYGMKLIIAGIIQNSEYFKNEIEPHVDGEFIKYIGSVGKGEKEGVLMNAYALLHPINFNEPFGLSIIEAMACGTPVIAFKKGSMPELILDGVTGYLTEDQHEIVKKLENIPKLDRRNCRKWVEEKFTQERMVKDYLRVYEKILAMQKKVEGNGKRHCGH
jgi:glycosyltransferase involved in cell wall biosynthesis